MTVNTKTWKGYLYVFRAGASVWKVGIAKDVSLRLRAVLETGAAGMPSHIEHLEIYKVSRKGGWTLLRRVENHIHRVLKPLRIDGATEWYEASETDFLALLKQAQETLTF